MNGPSGASAERLLKQAAVVIKKLEERVANLEEEKRARSEPIAIIGIGCRFPGGANSPQAFWELLQDGRDAVSSLEARWAFLGAKATSSMPRFAGLLTEPLDRFDAAFFGISPREARSLDPQQRLLLVTAWEALEDAGIPILSLENSRTGVFLGASSTDYLDLVSRCEKEERDAYSRTTVLRAGPKGSLLDARYRLLVLSCRGSSGVPQSVRKGV